MNTHKLSCILHVDAPSSDTVKLFDSSTWTKVKTVDAARRQSCTESKYFAVALPDTYSDTIGYHSQCYRKFTAVSSCKLETPQVVSGQTRLLRSSVDSMTSCTSTSGIFVDTCIFCNHVTKSTGKNKPKEQLGHCEFETGAISIKKAASNLKDEPMLVKLGDLDLIAKEIKYHHSCRNSYYKKAERIEKKTDGSDKLRAHRLAFENLKLHIEQTLIVNEGAEQLTSLHRLYMSNIESKESSYSAQSLCDKVRNVFPTLKITKLCKKSGVVVYSPTLSADVALRHAQDGHNLQEAAIYLRSLISESMRKNEQQNYPVTAASLSTDQVETPSQLLCFFQVLFTGSAGGQCSDQIDRQIHSLCDDVMFVTSRGRIKPSKHVCLGLGLKSLTGSRRIIEILNRFGHCVNYHAVESLETDLATVIKERNQSTPDGILKQAGLATGLAWDNYDENNETLTGAGTLHDTVGICYQNITESKTDDEPDNLQTEEINNHNDDVDTAKRTRSGSKRSFEVKELTLEPYRKKKPKLTMFQYGRKDVPPPENLTLLKYRDQLWMMQIASGPTPMWTGWNAATTEDPLPKQKVVYMENINLPPTRSDVIVETLKRSQEVAKECDERYLVVHYDLAVAKPALQIQCMESPRFDNLFIAFGPFHICLAYFGALGHFIGSSGGPEILTECEILASGSLTGFLSGKHYNRCKRLHPILATALQVLHFRQFLSEQGPIPESLMNDLAKLQDEPSAQQLQDIESSEEYLAFMQKYTEYVEVTMNGCHGSTAKFWMSYVQLVLVYLRFTRACRMNNLDLFIHALGEMRAIFFACNRTNYARWMVRYYLNLCNIDDTHPGLKDTLESGALSIRRTDKSFSRTAVDMTLEQTVNADAASRLTGIPAFGTLDSARRRWMITRSARSAIIGCLLTKAGLKKTEDITKDLKPYRIKKDNDDLNRVVDGIVARMNPFDVEGDTNLYCLTTGKSIPDDIKQDLLSCKQKGEAWCDEFMSGCFDDPTRFEKPIKRRKIKNFSSAAKKTIIRRDCKLIEVQNTRDLFGRLLYLSTKENVDLEIVFAYPLTAVPFSLGYDQGDMVSINKTNKATMMTKLEEMVRTTDPTGDVQVTIVDAGFLLHTLLDVPATFGEIASLILCKLCAMSSRVDLVCDTYQSPSIKDIERGSRGNNETSYTITGPLQRSPKNWMKALQSGSFKTSFFRFLMHEWAEHANLDVLSGHTIYLALDQECYRYSIQDKQIVCEKINELGCAHEEADTRIIYHLHNILQEDNTPSIVIRSYDTDVFLLLLYHVSTYDMPTTVWMDVGHSSNNTRRYIGISQLAEELPQSLINALLALHAFTGCDYTASFLGKGKVRPLNLMLRSDEYSNAFSNLGNATAPASCDVVMVEKFTCALYGMPKLRQVNDARLAKFQLKYAPKKRDLPLKKIKGADPSSMPPCQKVLFQKILRTNYVAALWKHATQPIPTASNPLENGWQLSDEGTYEFTWYDGDQMPDKVAEVLGVDDISPADESDEDLMNYDSENSDYNDDDDDAVE